MTNEKLMATGRWVSIVALATIAGIWAPAVANAAGTDAEAGKQNIPGKMRRLSHRGEVALSLAQT